MENKKEKIVEMFFINHLSVKEIAENVNVSSAYITKIIKPDARYMQEKQYRKEKSKEKRKQDKNNFIFFVFHFLHLCWLIFCPQNFCIAILLEKIT